MKKINNWDQYFCEDKPLGKGGNAIVYSVKEKSTGRIYALKELRNWHYNSSKDGKVRETKKRFENEIDIIKENAHKIVGIIPIIKCCKKGYWYTMPMAESVMNYIENRQIKEIIRGVIQLSETLELLHEKAIYHRDIKPANIYYYNGRFSLGDFGLVDFPDNFDNITRCDKGLGAIFTIAPEMKRNPKDADGKKADVFSLAKTMWMLLTKDDRGFDGVYDYLDKNHSLGFIDKYKRSHLVEIHELLRDSTANDPDARPTIKQFKERLENWLEVSSDTDKCQSSAWSFLSKLLFGLNPPDSGVWRDSQAIVDVLNIVGSIPAYNHMLFPEGGGLDFSYAEMAHETGWIKVYDHLGMSHVLKPKSLYYEGFGQKVRWNYFLLEIDEIAPMFETDQLVDREYLVEDRPGHYVSAQFVNYGVYDYDEGNPLPAGYQEVYRYYRGKFLIVMKTGPYNSMRATYDGRHGDCSANEFRDYIVKLINSHNKFHEEVKQSEQYKHLSDKDIENSFLKSKTINENPFKHAVAENDYMLEIKLKSAEKEKSRDYIANKFKTWNFQDVLESNVSEVVPVPMKFMFEFNDPNQCHSFSMFDKEYYYISLGGNIEKMDSALNENCYCVYDRERAIFLKHELENRVAKILKENNLVECQECETCFSIVIAKSGKPTHLFTKEEIEEAMRNADDRVLNQLVIDENGYVKVINDKNGYLYPVRHESWDAGNCYVGKYSELLTLDDNYIQSLQGWLSYLKYGRSQYMDLVHGNTDKEKLIAEIKTYY